MKKTKQNISTLGETINKLQLCIDDNFSSKSLEQIITNAINILQQDYWQSGNVAKLAKIQNQIQKPTDSQKYTNFADDRQTVAEILDDAKDGFVDFFKKYANRLLRSKIATETIMLQILAFIKRENVLEPFNPLTDIKINQGISGFDLVFQKTNILSELNEVLISKLANSKEYKIINKFSVFSPNLSDVVGAVYNAALTELLLNKYITTDKNSDFVAAGSANKSNELQQITPAGLAFLKIKTTPQPKRWFIENREWLGVPISIIALIVSIIAIFLKLK